MGTNIKAQVVWTSATTSADWQTRFQHSSVVFDDKIWVIGGYDGSWKNDIWCSSDGIKWIEITDSAAWSVRCAHSSVVYKDRMWIIGGDTTAYKFGTQDVWYFK